MCILTHAYTQEMALLLNAAEATAGVNAAILQFQCSPKSNKDGKVQQTNET